MWGMCLKWTIKGPEQCQTTTFWGLYCNFEQHTN